MCKLEPGLNLQYGSIVPIFPISDAQSGNKQWGDKPYFIYTQAFRVWHGLYVTKRSTFIYNLKAKPEDIFTWSTYVQKILDRQDDAAQDINDFNLSLPESKRVPVYFHSLRVYQSEPPESSNSTIAPMTKVQLNILTEYHFLD